MELQIASEELRIQDFYKPFPKQNLLHASPSKNLLGVGGNGSGKSATLLGEAIYTAFEYPGSASLLLRKDFRQLEKGLILDLRTTVPEVVITPSGRRNRIYKYNESKHEATFFNGSKLFFGHLKNGSERELAQYLSASFVWIGIDEVGQFSWEAWSFLGSRNRINPGCKPNADGYMPIPRMGGATNPMGPGWGWIKKIFVQGKPVTQMGEVYKKDADGKFYSNLRGEEKIVFDPHDHIYVHSTILDNPILMEKDPGYIEKLRKLPPALREKALYGNLETMAGLYYSNLSYDRHILSLPADHNRIKWEDWQPVWMGIDWGLAHHTAAYWFTRCQILALDGKSWRSCVVAYREHVVNETSYDDLARQIASQMPPEEIKRCRHVFLSPERFGRDTDPNPENTVGLKFGRRLHELGLPYASKANNRREDGAILIYDLLETGQFVMIKEGVPSMIHALESVTRDEKHLEDVLKTATLEDDCYDGTRYGLYSMLGEKGKPQEVKDAEVLEKIADPVAKQMKSYEQYLKRQKPMVAQRPRILPGWMQE